MQKKELENLEEFFKDDIPLEEFTNCMRRLQHVITLSYMNDNINAVNKEWLSSGYFWLNAFTEKLDPLLTKDKTAP